MLILTSNGLLSDSLIAQMRERGNSNGRAAIVTTASVGFKEKDWNIPHSFGRNCCLFCRDIL
jgi:hypothetical protein